MRKLFFCDLETTGLDPSKHGIHQISGALMIDGQIVEEFDWKVQPHEGCMVSQEALKVCGKTIEELKSYPPAPDVYRKLLALLGRHINKHNTTDKAYWVGYNANFDVGFARAFFTNMGDKYFGSWFWSAPVLDLMPLAGLVWPSLRPGLPNFKLGTVADALGIKPSGNLHDAKVDIDICVEMWKLIIAELGPKAAMRWFTDQGQKAA